MNRIIESFLLKHSEEYDLKCDKSHQFEHFINFISLRDHISHHFDPEIMSSGKGEVGIDGIAIVINGNVILDLEEAKDVFNTQSDISVSFIFTQAKLSNSFESDDISFFISTVLNFFDGQNKINQNNKISMYEQVKDLILNNAASLSENPSCYLYFAGTGEWNAPLPAQNIISEAEHKLRQLYLFDNVSITILDTKKISSLYTTIKRSRKSSIIIDSCTTIPAIPKVTESYIGVARCLDYLKLITNNDGLLISSLFEDNVRYFQGSNAVNQEIQQTLSNPEQQQAFSLLNNGITIVAKKIQRTGNNFVLSDFQIVNGCQTSVVLYQNENLIGENSYLTIKLISSIDKDTTDLIIRTTNRQTPISPEAFETLKDLHKNLENVYSAYPVEYRLYYERRSKQYDSESINKNKIISFPTQTKAYVAMFLSSPQSTHRYYGELLEANKKKIYNAKDVLEQYCIASMYLLSDRQIAKRYEFFKESKNI